MGEGFSTLQINFIRLESPSCTLCAANAKVDK